MSWCIERFKICRLWVAIKTSLLLLTCNKNNIYVKIINYCFQWENANITRAKLHSVTWTRWNGAIAPLCIANWIFDLTCFSYYISTIYVFWTIIGYSGIHRKLYIVAQIASGIKYKNQMPLAKECTALSTNRKMPPNTTNNSIESVSEQFQKLDLKALAREKGSYQVYPKTTVSICQMSLPLSTIQVDIVISTLLLNHLSTTIPESSLIPARLPSMTMLKRSLIWLPPLALKSMVFSYRNSLTNKRMI